MAWFTQLFIFCLLATATMGSTGSTGTSSPPTTSTSGTTEAPTSTTTSTSGTTEAPTSTTTSTSGTTEAPTSTTTSTSGMTEAPTSTTTSTSGTTEALTSTTTSTSATTGAPTSPATSTSATTGAPTSPTTSTSGTTGAPTSPATSTSGTTGAPTSMTTSTSGTTGAPTSPATSTSGTTEAPTSTTTSTSGTTGAPTSPTTSTSGTTGAPTSTTTSTSGTTGAPTSMTTSTSGTTGAPTSMTTSTSGTTGAPTSMTTSTSETTEAPPAPTTSTPRPGHCASSPCPRDSSCVELIDSFTCVCRPGLFYNEELNTCSLVKTFPSELRINKEFHPQMLDKSSAVFRRTSNEIISALSEAFKNQPGYMGSTVLSLAKGSVIADVDSAFRTESDVTKTAVEDILKNATDGILSNAVVTVKDTCSRGYCEERTTTCDAPNGLSTCTCRPGYVKIDATEQACMACPSGEKAVDSTTCEPCSFGYSGFNCNESYLLIVVIVSCVLGTLFLGTLVAVIAVSSRRPKQSTVSSEDSGTFSEFNKPARIPRIPRVNPDSGWQPANLETADSGSTRALVTKDRPESIAMENYYDAFNDYTRSQKNQTPSRSGYGNGNGYRARGVNNGSRGTRNPYYDEYDPDDGGFRRY